MTKRITKEVKEKRIKALNWLFTLKEGDKVFVGDEDRNVKEYKITTTSNIGLELSDKKAQHYLSFLREFNVEEQECLDWICVGLKENLLEEKEPVEDKRSYSKIEEISKKYLFTYKQKSITYSIDKNKKVTIINSYFNNNEFKFQNSGENIIELFTELFNTISNQLKQ